MTNNTCPHCQASWDALTDSLKECELTENFLLAVGILRNCRTCKTQLGSLAKECIDIALNKRELPKC